MGERLRPGAATFVEMFADDGVLEFPYAIPEASRIQGRAEIARHMEANARRIEFLGLGDVRVHGTGDHDVVIIDFAGYGRAVKTGARFEQRYVSIIQLRSGRIVHYVDYWNPIAILRAMRGAEFVQALGD